jgi:hypothetical protein
LGCRSVMSSLMVSTITSRPLQPHPGCLDAVTSLDATLSTHCSSSALLLLSGKIPAPTAACEQNRCSAENNSRHESTVQRAGPATRRNPPQRGHQLDPRHARQLGLCQYSHCLLYRSDRARRGLHEAGSCAFGAGCIALRPQRQTGVLWNRHLRPKAAEGATVEKEGRRGAAGRCEADDC